MRSGLGPRMGSFSRGPMRRRVTLFRRSLWPRPRGLWGIGLIWLLPFGAVTAILVVATLSHLFAW